MKLATLCTLGAALAAAPLAHSFQAQFIELGWLPNNHVHPSALVFGVSADGSTIAGCSSNFWPSYGEAVRWRVGQEPRGLGHLAGWGNSQAEALSPDGGTLVGIGGPTFTNNEAFLWSSAGSLVAFPQHRPQGVTDGGEFVAGTGSGSGWSGITAWRWSAAGGAVSLGVLVSAGHSISNFGGMSADGQSISGTSWAWSGGSPASEAYLWTASAGLVGLGLLPGATTSSALDISADGQVVVGFSSGPSGSRAFRWTAAGGMVSLGTLPGTTHSEALAVSGDGSVIVGRCDQNVPFLWTPALGMVDFRAHLILLGASGVPSTSASWTLRELSDDGNAIIGETTLPSSQGSPTIPWVAYLDTPQAMQLGETYCDPAVPNSSGQPAELRAFGSIVAQDDSVSLRASGLPPQVFGYFLNSRTQAHVPGAGGSLGTLCLGGMIGRYSAHVLNSGGAGEVGLQLQLAATPTPSGPAGVLAGESWNFQAWYRDSGGTSNFTNGTSIAFQ